MKKYNEKQLTGNIYQEKQHERRVPLASLANDISQAIFSRTGERYEPGTAREVFGLWGLAGGATDDWYITQVPKFVLHSRSNDSVGTFCGEGISTAVNLLCSPRASHTVTPLNCQSLMQPENPTASFCRLQASSGYFSIQVL